MLQEILNFINNIPYSNLLDHSVFYNSVLSSELNPLELCDACIDLFLQLNFTGPSDSTIETSFNVSPEVINFLTDELTCEGEVPFAKTKGLILLWIAKVLSTIMRQSSNSRNVFKSCLTYMKCIYLHQATLRDERSYLLKSQMIECFAQATKSKEEDSDQSIDPLDEFQLLLLSSHLHLIFYEYKISEQIFSQCQLIMGMSTELKGALGKRTKFQVDEVSQLYVEITRTESKSSRSINEALEKYMARNLPNDHFIDDEVLLDETSFVDKPNSQRPSLAEQAVLVLQAEIHKLSRAKDEATMEECSTFLSTALGNGNNRTSTWAIVTDALLQKSQLTTRSSRRTERSLMQLEELSNQFGYSLPSASSRLNGFFLARVPSIWELQLKLARILKSMGLIKSALDVLLPWDQWSAIIDCFIHLGHRERAEKLIRQRIEVDGETAELLCSLGDITKDRSHYERAWVVSKQRSARAMRSLAIHYMFQDMNHEKASECFERSLTINCLQVKTWFTFGCCCLQLKSYRKAVSAFKQCLGLEPDNYEAWNNCASALIELGEQKNALALLKEAVKYNYENWQVWDNICLVSSSVGEFMTTIKAYHRVMDLREQHRDPVTLAMVANAVNSGGVSENLDQVRSKLKELFARIASKDGRDPRIWTVYADFLANDIDRSSEATKTKVLQCLSRAHHGMCVSGWEHDSSQCKRVLVSTLKLVDKAFEYDVSYTSARLAVKSVKAVLQNLKSSQVEEFDEAVQKLLSKIDEAELALENKI